MVVFLPLFPGPAHFTGPPLAAPPSHPTNEVQLVAGGEPGLVRTPDFTCRFVSPPRHYSPGEGVTPFDRQGLAIHVTTLERTLGWNVILPATIIEQYLDD